MAMAIFFFKNSGGVLFYLIDILLPLFAILEKAILSNYMLKRMVNNVKIKKSLLKQSYFTYKNYKFDHWYTKYLRHKNIKQQ